MGHLLSRSCYISQAVIGTLQGIAWVLLIFFVIALTIGLGIRANRRPPRAIVPQEVLERSADA